MISREIETRLMQEAKKLGISVEALLEQLVSDREAAAHLSDGSAPKVPILHLGAMGPLHRRDIYEDVR